MDKKTIKKLKEAGFINSKFDEYKKMNAAYNSERSKGNGKEQSLVNASQKCGYSEQTIRRAVNSFKNLD